MNALRMSAVALAALIFFSGCAAPTPTSPEPTTEPSAGEALPPETSPEPESAAMPDFSGQEVVLVSTTATAPNGAAVDLALTAYYPVTVASAEGQAVIAYLLASGDTSDVSNEAFLVENDAILQVIDLSVVARSGAAWPEGLGVPPALGPGLRDTIVGLEVGSDVNGTSILSTPGTGFGVAALYFPAESDSEVTLDEWSGFWTYYGFVEDFNFEIAYSNCEVVTTDLAKQTDYVWGWDQFDCYVGVGH